MQTRRALLLAASLLAVGGCESIETTGPDSETQDGKPEEAQTGTETSVTRKDPAAKIIVTNELKQQLLAGKPVELIVEFETPSARNKGAFDVSASIEKNKLLRNSLLRELRAFNLEVVTEYQLLPMVVVRASSARALEAISQSDLVANVYENFKMRPATAESLGAYPGGINAGSVSPTDGNGSYVAIVDTGLDYNNSIFGTCNASAVQLGTGSITGCDVVGVTQMTKDGVVTSAANDDNQTDSDGNTSTAGGHGSLMAGVINSIAPAAKLWGYDVYPKDSNTTAGDQAAVTSADAILKALQDVLSKRQNNTVDFDVVYVGSTVDANPVLASSSGDCTTGNPFSNVIGQLYDLNVTVVVPTGNAGSNTEVLMPACDSRVISAGATWDASGSAGTYEGCSDTPAAGAATCFTNASSRMSLFAPGGLTTLALGNATPTNQVGTSIAAAHVAGAAAVLAGSYPSETPAYLKKRLVEGTTRSVTRTKTVGTTTTTVTKPFLDLSASKAATVCVATVSPSTVNLTSAAAGTTTITVTGNSGCTSASTLSVSAASQAWLTAVAGTFNDSTHVATVTLSATANTTVSSRTATITIANDTVTVTQAKDETAPTGGGSLSLNSPSASTYTSGPNQGSQYVADDDWNVSLSGIAVTDVISGTTLRWCLKGGAGNGTADNTPCTYGTATWGAGPGSGTVNVGGEGERFATLWVEDQAGNDLKVATISRFVEVSAPTVSGVAATDGNTSVALTWTASDPGFTGTANVIQYDVYRTPQASRSTEPTCSTLDANATNIKTLVNVISAGNVTVSGTVSASLDGATLAVSDVDGTTSTFELDYNSSRGAGNVEVAFTPATLTDTWTLDVNSTSVHGQSFDFNGTTYRLAGRMQARSGSGTAIEYIDRDVNSTVDLDFATLDIEDGETFVLGGGSLNIEFGFYVDDNATGAAVDLNITGLSTVQTAAAFAAAADARAELNAVVVSGTLVRVENVGSSATSDWDLRVTTGDLTTDSALLLADGAAVAGQSADTAINIATKIDAEVSSATSATVAASSNTVTFTSATPGASGVLSLSESAAGLTLTHTVTGVTQSTQTEIATALANAIDGVTALAVNVAQSTTRLTISAEVAGATSSLAVTGSAFTLGSPKMDNGNAVALAYTDSNVTVTTDGTGYWYTICGKDSANLTSTGASVLGRPRSDVTAPSIGAIDVTSISGVTVTPAVGNSGVAQLALQGYCDDNNATDLCYSKDANVTVRLTGITETGSLKSCVGASSTACTSASGPWSALTVDSNGTASLTVSLTQSGRRSYYVFVADAAFNASAAKQIDLYYDTQDPPNARVTLSAGVLSTNSSWAISRDTGSGNWQHRVVRAASAAPTAECTGDSLVENDTNTTATTAVDSGLTAGTTYFYRVCHRDRAGNWSEGGTASILARPEIDGPAPKTGTRSEIQTGPSSGVANGCAAFDGNKSGCEANECSWTSATSKCYDNAVMIGRIAVGAGYEGGSWSKKNNPRVFVEATDASSVTGAAPTTFVNGSQTVTYGASGMSVCFSASTLLSRNCSSYVTYESVLDTNGTGSNIALLNGDGARYVNAWIRDVWGNLSDADSNASNGYQPFRDKINIDRSAPTATGTATASLNATTGTVTISGAAQTDTISSAAGFAARGGVTYKAFFAKNSAPNASVCKSGTSAVLACEPTDTSGTVSCTWTPSPAPATGTVYGFRVCAYDGVDNASVGVATNTVTY